jgi:hypothetical protein
LPGKREGIQFSVVAGPASLQTAWFFRVRTRSPSGSSTYTGGT